LVDELNLQQFERGVGFRYIGGHYKGSPARVANPIERRVECYSDSLTLAEPFTLQSG
jgi:hypothetical protein